MNPFQKSIIDALPPLPVAATLDATAEHVICGKCEHRLSTTIRLTAKAIWPDGAWGQRGDGVWDVPAHVREHGRYRRAHTRGYRKITLPARMKCQGCGVIVLVDGVTLVRQQAQAVRKQLDGRKPVG
jgi:hypothetical protein